MLNYLGNMKILLSNDDGVLARGIWLLAEELKHFARVVVVAPDREQSAVGTAVTLRHPLRVQPVKPMVPGIEAYSVDGTPADSVILALSKLAGDETDLVISGINQGLNLGDDVLISGTVGAALQGYLRGCPAIAVSVAAGADDHSAETAAKLAALLAKKLGADTPPANVLLNVNLPDMPLSAIRGIKLTRLASKSHINSVAQGHDGKKEYYWLVRQQLNTIKDVDRKTDIWAVENGYVSITALYTNLFSRPPHALLNGLCSGLFHELQQSSPAK